MRTDTPPVGREIVIFHENGAFEFGKWNGRVFCAPDGREAAFHVVGWSTVKDAIALAKQRRDLHDVAHQLGDGA